MSPPAENRLLQALRAPESLAALAAPEWHPLILQARRTGLLGVLAVRAEAAGVEERLPDGGRHALLAGRVEALQRERMLDWETRRILRALLDCGAPAILLKGAAYAALGLPISRGRLTGDVDILVHRTDLAAVEASLQAHGWSAVVEDSYDQRYYRTYMHELPPLRHDRRGTVIDVHHTIAPPTSRIRIDGELLWPTALETAGGGMLTLGRADLVLHAIIHLFHEGNLAGGLRDLCDIDGLLRHFGADPQFWDELLARAELFDARRLVAYALRYASLLMHTPVPEAVRQRMAGWGAPAPVRQVMDALVVSALLSPTAEGGLAARGAGLALYVRSHWRRMPPVLLARHLLRKAARRPRA